MNDQRERCGVTGKVMFPTAEAAWAMVAAYARAKGTAKITKRCPFCESYHTTKGVRGKPGKGRR